MTSELELISEHGSFGGVQRFYRHLSNEIGLPMQFSVYLPPQALTGERCPAIFYLSGLTCTEETFPAKAGAQRVASNLGVILISPDTSPRGANVPGETDNWDFGVGAGFYLDAKAESWSRHYRMYSYLVSELYERVVTYFNLDRKQIGIMGHSMGGHGALVLALRNPNLFRSVSAFSPISAPTQCPWGQKAFSGYLGTDKDTWVEYDATELMQRCEVAPFPKGILIDQGENDKFLKEQLHPHLLAAACEKVNQPLLLRRHDGYDHGYYFISTFIEDHLVHHAKQLGQASELKA